MFRESRHIEKRHMISARRLKRDTMAEFHREPPRPRSCGDDELIDLLERMIRADGEGSIGRDLNVAHRLSPNQPSKIHETFGEGESEPVGIGRPAIVGLVYRVGISSWNSRLPLEKIGAVDPLR